LISIEALPLESHADLAAAVTSTSPAHALKISKVGTGGVALEADQTFLAAFGLERAVFMKHCVG